MISKHFQKSPVTDPSCPAVVEPEVAPGMSFTDCSAVALLSCQRLKNTKVGRVGSEGFYFSMDNTVDGSEIQGAICYLWKPMKHGDMMIFSISTGVAYLPSTVSTFDIAHKVWVDLTSSLGSEYEGVLDSIGKICKNLATISIHLKSPPTFLLF